MFEGLDNVFSISINDQMLCTYTRKLDGVLEYLVLWEWELGETENFVEGCVEVDIEEPESPNDQATLKCPICRTKNNLDRMQSIPYIKGLDTKCSVCLEANAEVVYPDCAHIATCKACFLTLLENSHAQDVA